MDTAFGAASIRGCGKSGIFSSTSAFNRINFTDKVEYRFCAWSNCVFASMGSISNSNSPSFIKSPSLTYRFLITPGSEIELVILSFGGSEPLTTLSISETAAQTNPTDIK